MKRVCFLLSMTLILTSCGKKDESSSTKSDYGYGKVVTQETHLNEKYQFQFGDSVSLDDSSKCDGDLLDDSLIYLDLSQSYYNKVISAGKHKNNQKLNLVVKKHNNVIDALNSILGDWEKDCSSTYELKKEKVVHASAYKGKLKDNIPSSSLLNHLEKIESYSKLKSSVLSAFNNGVTPNMKDVLSMHLYQQVVYSKERQIEAHDVEAFRHKLNLIIEKLPANINSMNLGLFKVSYESEIERRLGKAIIYNKAYYSIPSKVSSGKTQCLGGTKTDLVLNILSKGFEEYYNRRPVVILQSGHILPGYLIGHDSEWHLYGIETTASGKGEIYFGNIQELSKLDKKSIVIDAYDYLYLNAIQAYIKNPNKTVRKAIKNFAKKYNIKNIKQLLNEYAVDTFSAQSGKSDIFSFGSSSQERGNFQRKYIKEKSVAGTSYITQEAILKRISDGVSRQSKQTKIESIRNKLNSFGRLSIPSDGQSGGSSIAEINLDGEFLPIYSVRPGKYSCYEEGYSANELFQMNINYETYTLQIPEKAEVLTLYQMNEYTLRFSEKGEDFQFIFYKKKNLDNPYTEMKLSEHGSRISVLGVVKGHKQTEYSCYLLF